MPHSRSSHDSSFFTAPERTSETSFDISSGDDEIVYGMSQVIRNEAIQSAVAVAQSSTNCPEGRGLPTGNPIAFGRVAALVMAFDETDGVNNVTAGCEKQTCQETERASLKDSPKGAGVIWSGAPEISDVAWIKRTEDISVLIRNASDQAVVRADVAERPAVSLKVRAEEDEISVASKSVSDSVMDCSVERNNFASEHEVFPSAVKQVRWAEGQGHGNVDVTEIEISAISTAIPYGRWADKTADDDFRTRPGTRGRGKLTCGLPRGRSLRRAMTSLKGSLSRSLSRSRRQGQGNEFHAETCGGNNPSSSRGARPEGYGSQRMDEGDEGDGGHTTKANIFDGWAKGLTARWSVGNSGAAANAA